MIPDWGWLVLEMILKGFDGPIQKDHRLFSFILSPSFSFFLLSPGREFLGHLTNQPHFFFFFLLLRVFTIFFFSFDSPTCLLCQPPSLSLCLGYSPFPSAPCQKPPFRNSDLYAIWTGFNPFDFELRYFFVLSRFYLILLYYISLIPFAILNKRCILFLSSYFLITFIFFLKTLDYSIISKYLFFFFFCSIDWNFYQKI